MPDFNDLIGRPFDKMNCAECAIEVFRRYGITLPAYEFEAVAVMACEAALRSDLIDRATNDPRWRPVAQPTAPCLVVFRGRRGYHDHVGVYIGDGGVIHADRKMGVIVSNINSPKWTHLVAGYYEFAG